MESLSRRRARVLVRVANDKSAIRAVDCISVAAAAAKTMSKKVKITHNTAEKWEDGE